MRWALGLEYCGVGFLGWQRQPSGPTVQAALETALASIAGHSVSAQAAGRTDRGVHAMLQVVHFDTEVERSPNAWVRGTNCYLPAGVAVRWAQPVDSSFHARFSAVRRCYRYFLLSDPVRPALLAGRVGWTHWPLDIEAIQTAALALIGQHDFSAFRASDCQAKSAIKQIYAIEVLKLEEIVEIRCSANAFLYHMVRNIVAALVHVGSGRASAAWLVDLLGSQNRSLAPATFSAEGLYLAGVQYPPEYPLRSWGVSAAALGWRLPTGS